MTLPNYKDPYYEAARQKRRYHSDPVYRLDRINRARTRFGLAPHKSLLHARVKFMFSGCLVNAPMLRRARIVAGFPVAAKRTQARKRHDRLTVLRKRVAA